MLPFAIAGVVSIIVVIGAIVVNRIKARHPATTSTDDSPDPFQPKSSPAVQLTDMRHSESREQPRPTPSPTKADHQRVETVCLVSCVGAKRSTAALAKDLYQSDWFNKARAYAELNGPSWFILSAKYGLIHPDEVIEPYERTLNTMGVAERQVWARLVQRQMDQRMPDASRIVVWPVNVTATS